MKTIKTIIRNMAGIIAATIIDILGIVYCSPANAQSLRTAEDSIRFLIRASEALTPTSSAPLKTSDRGIVRLKNEEGQPFTYQPGVGAQPVLTVYDDNGTPAAAWGNSRRWMIIGETITQQQAEQVFAEDLAVIEERVNEMLRTLPYYVNWASPMLQPVFDSIVSQVYRAGKTNVMASPFWQHLRLVRTSDEFTFVADMRFACTYLSETYLMPEHKADHIRSRNQRDVQACLTSLSY